MIRRHYHKLLLLAASVFGMACLISGGLVFAQDAASPDTPVSDTAPPDTTAQAAAYQNAAERGLAAAPEAAPDSSLAIAGQAKPEDSPEDSAALAAPPVLSPKRAVPPAASAKAGPADKAVPVREKVLSVDVNRGELLTLDRPAASVFVANPAIADIQLVAPDRAMVFGKAGGETTLLAIDDRGQVIVRRLLVVRQNVAELKRLIANFIPESKVDVTAVPGGMILAGRVQSAADADDAVRLATRFVAAGGEVINRLSVEGANQVMLRVRVAEVARSVTKSFGINWESTLDIGTASVGLAFGDPISIVDGVISRPDSTNSIFFRKLGSTVNVTNLVNALSGEGLVTVLAEPNLTAMSGEAANFVAGGQRAVPVPQGDGTIAIEYQNYGVLLSFTPTIVSRNRINLKVRPEVSELSATNSTEINGVPLFDKNIRSAETTVELGSGQSFVVGGLLRNDFAQDVDKLPFFGDLPVLGALFRSQAYRKGETELVIIVTPYLVRPSDETLSAPTDRMQPPSDLARILLGKTVSTIDDPSPTVNLNGPVGFEME